MISPIENINQRALYLMLRLFLRSIFLPITLSLIITAEIILSNQNQIAIRSFVILDENFIIAKMFFIFGKPDGNFLY